MNIKEDDVVQCTVKKIEKTTVFVTIDGNGEGSIVMSEIAAGRIRNIREYVVPNKKIICKVLRISNNHIQLTLRRVTGKERELAMDRYKKEKTFTSMLKTITPSPSKIIEEIKQSYTIPEFLEEARENPKIIESFLNKKESAQLSKILEEKKEKDKIVKKTFTLKSTSPSGLSDIKEILKIKDCKINYLGSSKFSISTSAKNFKEANAKLSDALNMIAEKAKKKNAQLEIKDKK